MSSPKPRCHFIGPDGVQYEIRLLIGRERRDRYYQKIREGAKEEGEEYAYIFVGQTPTKAVKPVDFGDIVRHAIRASRVLHVAKARDHGVLVVRCHYRCLIARAIARVGGGPRHLLGSGAFALFIALRPGLSSLLLQQETPSINAELDAVADIEAIHTDSTDLKIVVMVLVGISMLGTMAVDPVALIVAMQFEKGSPDKAAAKDKETGRGRTDTGAGRDANTPRTTAPGRREGQGKRARATPKPKPKIMNVIEIKAKAKIKTHQIPKIMDVVEVMVAATKINPNPKMVVPITLGAGMRGHLPPMPDSGNPRGSIGLLGE
ncbi:MAG: hypothetical protein M1827_001369 [Pycnora praestabilis]|nr:MAG: hypothetical protein M1827_001369 [Pycnora praestabilis]